MADRELTFGEETVGVSFNPTQNSLVRAVNLEYARVIDWLNELREETDNPEVKTLCSAAIDEAKSAHSSAMKAVTLEINE